MALRGRGPGRRTRGARPELVGSVTSSSGDLLVLDFGLLRLWSGDLEPVLDPGVLPPDVVERANSFADFEITGPDAAIVSSSVDLAAVKGRYAIDMPADDEFLAERVRVVAENQGLRASVRPIDRMPHHQRVLRLLDERPEGVEVPFHGVWGVAIRGVPVERRLPVYGARMPDGPDAGRWHSVWVELAPDEPTRSVEAGYVLVDEARLMFADPVALNGWKSDEAMDGLADLAFWGRDAATVANRIGAPILESASGRDIFGWADLPVAEVVELGRRLHELHNDPLLKFAFDFRPHDDHHRVLAQARANATESGTIEVAGLEVTGFFTTWGDGAFPVYRDLAPDGHACRLRVELASI